MPTVVDSKVVFKSYADAFERARLVEFVARITKVIGIIFLVTITTGYFDAISAQSPTDEEMLFLKLYLCGEKVDNHLVDLYGTSDSAKANEFSRREYYESEKARLHNGINSVSFAKRFVALFDSELGEYSFSRHGFPLKRPTIYMVRSNA